MKFNTEYFIQNYTCEDGNIARFIIPENVTDDDVKGIKETLDVILERHFKVLMKGE